MLPPVYVERALVNPTGDDAGKEVVVIGNTTLTDVNLSGWSIVDKNNTEEALAGLLPSGGSLPIVLSGSGAQLSNKGGTIRLLNPYRRADSRRQLLEGGRRRESVRQVQYVT